MMRSMFSFLVIFCMSHVVSGQSFQHFQDQVFKFEGVNNFGAYGFGLYDYGDLKYKIFNWKFRKIHEFSIKKGEGPGELKYEIVRACVIKDKLFINPLYDSYIEVYDIPTHKYGKRIKIAFQAELFATSKQELCLFNKSLLENTQNKGQRELAHIINPDSGAPVKKILFPVVIDMSKYTPDEQRGISDNIRFFLDNNDRLHVLSPKEQILYCVSPDGKLVSKRKAPGKLDFKMKYAKMGNEKVEIYSTTSFYEDFFIHNENFVGIYTSSDREKSPKDDPETGHLHWVKKDGKYTQKSFPGFRFHLLYGAKDFVFLINRNSYDISSIKISELEALPQHDPR